MTYFFAYCAVTDSSRLCHVLWASRLPVGESHHFLQLLARLTAEAIMNKNSQLYVRVVTAILCTTVMEDMTYCLYDVFLAVVLLGEHVPENPPWITVQQAFRSCLNSQLYIEEKVGISEETCNFQCCALYEALPLHEAQCLRMLVRAAKRLGYVFGWSSWKNQS